MSLYEHQAKDLLRSLGVAVPRGICCVTPDDAVSVAKFLGGTAWIMKNQIYPSPRNLRGRSIVAGNLDEVRAYASQVLGSTNERSTVDHRTNRLCSLLIEEWIEPKNFHYLALAVSWPSNTVAVVASPGPIDSFEDVAKVIAANQRVFHVDPNFGLSQDQAIEVINSMGIPRNAALQTARTVQLLYEACANSGAVVAEISRLVIDVRGVPKAVDVAFRFGREVPELLHALLSYRQGKTIEADVCQSMN